MENASRPTYTHALRIGVVVDDRLIDERIYFGGKPLRVGTARRSQMRLPSAQTMNLTFAKSAGGFTMRSSAQIDGQLKTSDELLSFAQAMKTSQRSGSRKDELDLPLSARGRIKLAGGNARVLFQVISAQPRPRPIWAPSVRGNAISMLDHRLTKSFAASFAVVLGALVYFHSVDPPLALAADRVREQIWHEIPRKPLVLRPKVTAQIARDIGERPVKRITKTKTHKAVKAHKQRRPTRRTKVAKKGRSGGKTKLSREQLAKQVSRMGAMAILGSQHGKKPGHVSNLLSKGNPISEANRAFKNVDGLTLSARKTQGLRSTRSGRRVPVRIGSLGNRITGPSEVKIKRKVIEKVPVVVRPARKLPRIPEIDTDRVTPIIRRGMRGLAVCYQRGLNRNGDLGGKLELTLTIASTGKVTRVELDAGQSFSDPVVNACIKRRAKAWRFPPPKGSTSAELSFPVLFKKAQQ
jgi:hypothetical protein